MEAADHDNLDGIPAASGLPPESLPTSVTRVTSGALLLVALTLAALFYYKWGGSLRTLGIVRSSGKLPIAPSLILDGGVLTSTLAYLRKIGPALGYGILVGAAVRAALPAAWVRRWLGGRGARTTFVGALAGAPLMLCACCVTPVFTGVYHRGARLGSALALLLASPGLNLAALVLTFALMPARVGFLRVAASLVIVLGLSALVGRTFGERARTTARPGTPPKTRPVVSGLSGALGRAVSEDDPVSGDGAATDDESPSPGALLARFARSIGVLVVLTVPWIVAGVLMSAWLLPHVNALTGAGTVVAVLAVGLLGTLAALPTFFEIPIGLLLLASGAPVPVVVAFVVAGPAVNLPSLLVLARETGIRVALALGAGVWMAATAAGLVAML